MRLFTLILRDAAKRPLLRMRIGPLTPECQCRIKNSQEPSGSEYHHGRTAARATETNARNPTFLGWHAGRRTAPAALRRLRQCVFSAAAVLPEMRLAQGQRVQGQRQGKTLQLRDPSPSG